MTNNLIDVHILHMPNENQDWWKLCDASLKNHPINIYNCDGIYNNVGEARKLAFSQGTSPYVSFVDPDDIVLPGAFQQCLDVLEQNPNICGVYTTSNIMTPDGIVNKYIMKPYRPWSLINQQNNCLEIHQLVVMRREYVTLFYDTTYPRFPLTNLYSNSLLYLGLANIAPWISIDFVGYTWRHRIDGIHAITTESKYVNNGAHLLWNSYIV